MTYLLLYHWKAAALLVSQHPHPVLHGEWVPNLSVIISFLQVQVFHFGISFFPGFFIALTGTQRRATMSFLHPRLSIILGTYLLLSTQSSTCQLITVDASNISAISYEPNLGSSVWDIRAFGEKGKILSTFDSTDANATFNFLGKYT